MKSKKKKNVGKKRDQAHAFSFKGKWIFLGIARHRRGNPRKRLAALLQGVSAEKRKSWPCPDTRSRVSSYDPNYAK